MQLPRIRNGKPLILSGAPAVSDDPCTCCNSTPCYGCQFPLTMTCTIVGFDPLGLDCLNIINSPKAQCGGWNTTITMTRNNFQASSSCYAQYTGIVLYDPCAVNPLNREKNATAVATFTYNPNTNTHSYSLAADAGSWHGEISGSGLAGCPRFIYGFSLSDTGSICTGSPTAHFA